MSITVGYLTFGIRLGTSSNMFEWSDEEHLTVRAGDPIERDVIEWEHGDIEIDPFSIEQIKIRYYRDEAATDEILPGNPDWMIGDQGLDEIIKLDNFMEHNDGSGEVTLVLDPTDITLQELMKRRQIYVVLEVEDPN